MIAKGSESRTGVQFTPADICIQLDGQWTSLADVQTSGRIQRQRPIQPAAQTETFRVLGVSDYFPLGTMLMERHKTQQDLKKRLG